jgi:L-fuculose-phosphate aldolase
MREELGLREDLIWVCRQLDRKGLIAATDGNVSCRLGKKSLLVTPAGACKAELQPADLLVTDLEGLVLRGPGAASSELRMHLLVYAERIDVRAAVHAHPPLLTAFTLAGLPFLAETLPEVWLNIGAVATAPYATPSTEDVPAAIAPFIGSHQAVLLERHGSLTLGKDLREAYFRLEKLEHAAHVLLYARLLGERMPQPLPQEELAKLSRMVKTQDASKPKALPTKRKHS